MPPRPVVMLVAGLVAVGAPHQQAEAEPPPAAVTLDRDCVTIPPGPRSRRDTVESLARLVNAQLLWPPDTADSVVEAAMNGVPIEQALPRLLEGLDWTVVWQPVSSTDRMRWQPVEIRIGASSAHTAVPSAAPIVSSRAEERPDSLEHLFDRLRRAADERARRALADEIAAAALTSAEARMAAAHWLDLSEPDHVRAVAIEVASRRADAALLKQLEHHHREQGDVNSYGNVLELIRRARSDEAVPALITWAGEIEAQPASPRARAALQGLASVGSGPSVDFILDRFESASTEAREALRDALLAAAPTSTALSALRSAAEGRRGANSDEVRLTALESLARFPDSLTVDLVRRMANGDPSPAVRGRAAQLVEAWMDRPPSSWPTAR